MGIEFKLEPLDSEPFYHGYGEKCSDAQLTVGIWKLPLVDLKGNKIVIPFYITKGNGLLLLGNEVLSKSDVLNTKGLLKIPPKTVTGLVSEIALSTYTTQDAELRTHLHVVMSQSAKFRNYFSSCRALLGSDRDTPVSKKTLPRFMGKTAKQFAMKLHMYSHLPLRDMKALCERGGVLTPVLTQALESVTSKCSSCQTTGRPHNVRKISLNKPLRTFNEEVQLDYEYITELTKQPILHMKDNASGLCAATVTPTRDMEEAGRLFEINWITVHGAPASAKFDQEFDNEDFRVVLKKHDIQPKPIPARRHNKIGSVESANFTLRKLAVRLLKDAEHERDTKGTGFTVQEIISRAVLAHNLLRGQKKLSSFELARGYTPAIGGMPQTPADSELVNAHLEQVARRALSKMLDARIPNTVSPTILTKSTPVYFFEKRTKHGVWNLGYVQDANEHLVQLTRSKYGSGKRLKVAYEDIRLYPSSSLLQELDMIELAEQGQAAQVLEGSNYASDVPTQVSSPPIPHSAADNQPASAEPHTRTGRVAQPFALATHLTGGQREADAVHDIGHTRVIVPKSATFLAIEATAHRSDKAVDMLQSTPMQRPAKDIGSTHLGDPPPVPAHLESQEQTILQDLRRTLGDDPLSESKLACAPRWVVDKAIRKEKENYSNNRAYIEVNVRNIPRDANVVSSHCFFQIKQDGESDKLKLKCRLVPHGNRDKEKDNIRKDSATAQFPVIRALLSAAAIFGFRLGSIDISSAYLQAGRLNRDVYVRLPKGWTPSSFIFWKLLVPAYGLVESGRLWQLAVEEWMREQKVELVPGLTQIFVLRNEDNSLALIIAKVVDDFLLAGSPFHIKQFHDAIAQRFKVGRFICDSALIFNRLHIHQDASGDITVSMQEYMDTIVKIPVDRIRRKEYDSKCTLEETKLFQALAGQLNWLGHGVLGPAAFVSSFMQQMTSDLRVSHLCDANRALHEIRKLIPTLLYRKPTPADLEENSATYLAFSDASQGKTSYGQTGYISGIYFSISSTYHVIDWHSSKQSRVSFSSMGAEILAAAESADRAALMSFSLQQLFHADQLPLVLTVDSHGLFSTITTLHQGRDYRLRPTVERLRDSFETQEISVLQWIKGVNNIADALTKRNLDTFQKLNATCVEGSLQGSLLEDTERVTNC